MKTIIISPHEAPNYGTMLQAYALQKVLSTLGCESEYIRYNFRPVGLRYITCALTLLLENPYGFIKKIAGKSIGEDYTYFYNDDRFASTWQAFKRWHEQYIVCMKEVYNHKTLSKLEDKASMFLVGSDQTWSPLLTKWYPAFYLNFLEFVNDDKKKNSYAPSFGTFRFTKRFQKKVVHALSSFANLSCRELKGAKWLEQELNRTVQAVLDPTLLLKKADWDKVAKPMRNLPSEYVLCYQLGSKKSIPEFSQRLGKALGLPVYHILTRPESLSYHNCLSGVGPGEFISLIRGASCVCTDSFHGTIFCINYNKPFFSFAKREESDPLNDNDRITNVLTEFNLENRFRSDTDNDTNLCCSFDMANRTLSLRRQESLNYLNQIINASLSN